MTIDLLSLSNDKFDKSGGTISGNITIDGNITISSGNVIISSGSSLTSLNASELKSGTVDSNRLPNASTTSPGIVQLNDTVSSTSTTQAATANATKIANDNANTRALQTTTVSAGTGLSGGGSLESNRIISHADTSTQASVNNSDASVIQDVTLDEFGHVTGLGSVNLDGRFVNVSGDTMSGSLSATAFTGDGSGLTSLDASNLSSGTVPDARITGAYTGITDLTASGTVTAGTFSGSLPWTDIASVPSSSTTTAGIVQLNNTVTSTSTTLAATANAAKIANDNANTRALQTTTVSAGSGLTGGGSLASNRTISHADTSTQPSVDNVNGTVIQDVTLDGFGHVTGLGSIDLDSRYYTEAESDSRFVNVSGDTMSGDLSFGTTVRQMINLWSTSFGIGVQNSTTYFRTGGNFAWYSGGSHDDNQLNAGGGTAMMALTGTGLGLGTTSPSQKLDVRGQMYITNRITINNNNPTICFQDTDHNSAFWHCNANLMYLLGGDNNATSWRQVNGQWPFLFYLSNNNATCGGSFYAIGDVTAYASDARLKTDITPLEKPLDIVKHLCGYTFTWKEGIHGMPMSGDDVGLIVQDIERTGLGDTLLAPAPFDLAEDQVTSKSGKQYKTIKYNKLHAIWASALREQQVLIESQEERIRALEDKLGRLVGGE